ncbi:MAG: GNAT family N-acetyltransferase [candidate division Zixibacteria bacterium]|nr:GNAT family N-acetyltransferase [candidate division Zixibacteria bacterium]
MGFELLYLADLDEQKWEELLFNSPYSTFYHKSAWAKLWFSSFVYFTPLFLVYSGENGEYKTGFPFILSDKYRLKRAYSMPFGTYGGMILSKELSSEEAEELYRKIDEELRKLKLASVEVIDFFGQQKNLSQYGYNAVKAYTHLLDLSKYMDDPVHKTKRGAIQAEKKGVKVEPLSSVEKIRDCYSLVLERDKRHGLKRSKFPLGLYENIWNILKSGEELRWSVATVDEQTIAFQINFLYKNTIYYWEGASLSEALNLRPNDALFSDTIQWGISQGYRYFNLGGSPEKAEGLVRFKEAWGGERKDYLIYSKKKFWYKAAEKLKRLL